MKADRFWKGAARAAFDLAFPRRCPFCGAVIGWLPQCTDCKAKTDAVLHRPFSLSATEQGLQTEPVEPDAVVARVSDLIVLPLHQIQILV